MTDAPGPSDLDLRGRWRIAPADEERRRTWNDDDFDDADFLDVDVPGHWRTHPDLADADGPMLYRRHFQSLRPTEDQRAWLWVDGIFYQGDVWLDGDYLGDTEGYFAPHRFEITDALRARTDHVLGIEVTCAPVTDRNAKRALTGVYQDGPFLDPAWNPGGIWRGVRIRRTGPVAIAGLRVLCTDASTERALVTFHATLDAARPGTVTIESTIGSRDHRQSRTLAAGSNQVTWTVPVDDPVLWWPHALGDQPLHDVTVTVVLGDTADPTASGSSSGSGSGDAIGSATAADAVGRLDGLDGLGELSVADDLEHARIVSDTRATTVGLRRVTLDDFILSVNGEQLYVKGVCTGPTDATPATTDPAALARLVDTTVDAGLDLLRVVAHVARPELYAAADRAGLLIWQDLPMQWGYHRSVRRAAAAQAGALVDLLGHHPSIAVWCGQNEPDLESRAVAPERPQGLVRLFADHELPNWNRSVLTRSIRRAFASADPSRPIVAGSGVWPHPPKLNGTDVHLALGWGHGTLDDLPALARAIPRAVRFVGAFGSASVPAAADFIDDAGWPDLDWDHLALAYGMDVATFERHLPPDAFLDAAEWGAATRNYQAIVIRTVIEMLRRLKYRPSGGYTAFFLADARPAISASLIDASGTPKPAFDALVQASRPVIATLDPWPSHLHPGDVHALDVHVISDLRTPLADATLTVRQHWDGGEHLNRFGGDLAADSCTYVGTVEVRVPDIDGPFAVTLSLTSADHDVECTYTGRVHTH